MMSSSLLLAKTKVTCAWPSLVMQLNALEARGIQTGTSLPQTPGLRCSQLTWVLSSGLFTISYTWRQGTAFSI